VVAALVVLLLALPGPAGASARSIPVPAGRPEAEACPVAHLRLNVIYDCVAEFTLTATDGYRLTVSGEPGVGSQEVELSVVGHGASATYTVPGKVTATTIEAGFGRFGGVSVRFRPSGAERHVRLSKSCRTQRPPVVSSRLGSFVGRIRFRGDGGYTQVSAGRARGGVGDPLANTDKKPTCQFQESAAQRRRELRSVSLDGSPPGSGTSFTAARLFGSWSLATLPTETSLPPGPRYLFLAFSSERAARVRILRAAGAIGGAADFVFDDALEAAKVTPPYPFTGTGTFVREPGGPGGWTGNLAVPLPGLGRVGLTGGRAELATVATHLRQLEEEETKR
jgi:hypothetical protein